VNHYLSRVAHDELLTVKQIARELGLANTRVMSLIRREKIVAASRPAGPAPWRVTRQALDAYLEAERIAASELKSRRRDRQLKELVGAWANLSEEELMRIEAEVPTDLLRPLKRLIDSARTQHNADLDALAQAYGRCTEAGVEELALALPQDLSGRSSGSADTGHPMRQTAASRRAETSGADERASQRCLHQVERSDADGEAA
jgi:hypothetical protein